MSNIHKSHQFECENEFWNMLSVNVNITVFILRAHSYIGHGYFFSLNSCIAEIEIVHPMCNGSMNQFTIKKISYFPYPPFCHRNWTLVCPFHGCYGTVGATGGLVKLVAEPQESRCLACGPVAGNNHFSSWEGLDLLYALSGELMANRKWRWFSRMTFTFYSGVRGTMSIMRETKRKHVIRERERAREKDTHKQCKE